VESNEIIVSSRIKYEHYKNLHQIRLDRGAAGKKKPTISEIIREAIIKFIGEQNEQSDNQ
jgi:metal-responsive CopG/Arc/MetJ family transcriptional regulator